MKTKEKKSPWRAVILSALVFPGAGQIYNGDRLKGYLLIALGLIISLLLILKVIVIFTGYYQGILAEHPTGAPGAAISEELPSILLFLGLLLALWVYSMVDAYLGGRV